MAPAVGAICLIGAGGTGVVSLVVPHRAGRALAQAQCALIATATAILGVAMVRVDGRYTEVADTTSRLTPWPYRVAGLWGGLRGSMLFLTFTIAIVGLLMVRGPIGRKALTAFIGVLTIVVVTTANPFGLLAVPATDGGGLTPILRHPAMLIHPPMLYAGLAVLISAAFARVDERAVGTVNGSILVGAGVLSAALALGSWWSSAELGWVGLWAWDPVENAGLVPLLLAIAAVHTGPGRSPRRPTTALVMLAGWTAFAGTVLTRSGAALSVHAFADAQQLGKVLGGLALLLLIAGIVTIVATPRGWAEPTVEGRRQVVGTTAVALAVGATVVVVAGTVGPLLGDVFGGERSTVDGTFFARWTAPFAVLALGALAFAGHAARADRASRQRLIIGEALALGAAALAYPIWRSPWVSLVIGLAVWSLAVPTGRLPWPVALAHAGLALTIAGAVLSGAGGSSSAPLKAGRSVSIQGWTVRFDALETVRLTDRERVIARTTVLHDGSVVSVLRPSLDRWNDMSASLAESATTSWRGVDLQLVLRTVRRDAATPAGAVVLDVHVRPLIRLAWWGPVLMAIGLCATAAGRVRRRASGDDESAVSGRG